MHELLRRREAHKYVTLGESLAASGVRHEFEYPLPGSGFVFDLSVPTLNLLVEFDGVYHRNPVQAELDRIKDEAAIGAGWTVMRIVTPPGVLGQEVIRRVLEVCDQQPP